LSGKITLVFLLSGIALYVDSGSLTIDLLTNK
jgi:hypothetical protein